MTLKVQIKSKKNPKSSQTYKRTSESEMFDIIKEIHEEGLPKKDACVKYGLNRDILKCFILKNSTKDIIGNHLLDLLSIMNENKQHLALTKND